MKHLFSLLFISSLSFQSCVTHVPIKGKYQEGSVKSELDRNFESVWESMIDVIAKYGLSVKLIDKSSGLILSDRTSFYGNHTYEVKGPKPKDPEAYILTSRTSDDINPAPYRNVTALYNIRIKPVQGNKSQISVNMHSVQVESVTFNFRGLSLHNFEKWVIDLVASGSE